jgi:hypothetical protein
VVALACYLDDSFDQQVHVVAGYLGEVEIWKRVFTPAWNEIISGAPHPITEFKASDCRIGRGEFGPPWTKEERDDLASRLVSLIVDTPSYAGVAAAFLWPGNPDPASPRVGKHRRSMEQIGYGISIGRCFAHAFWLSSQAREADSVQPIIDNRKTFFNRVTSNYDYILKQMQPDAAKKMQFPMSGDSKDHAPLQAADLFAHETFREVIARREDRPPSQELERLFSGHTPYVAQCIAMPHHLVWNLLRPLGVKLKPTEHILFKRGRPLRAPGNWYVA